MSVFISTEDRLSSAVARRIIFDSFGADLVVRELGNDIGGNAIIRKNLSKYMQLARREFVLIVTDLDKGECAPTLRNDWFSQNDVGRVIPDRLIFCVAVREVEAWLLADRETFAEFLGVSSNRIERAVETNVVDPKQYLVELARLSRKRDVKSDIVPSPRNTARVGLGYNERLIEFVQNHWMPVVAAQNNASLRRTIERVSLLRG